MSCYSLIANLADCFVLGVFMKVMVTGGGGFLGRHIVKQLLQEGYQVRIFNRKHYPEIEQLGVEGMIGDLTDYDSVRLACRGMDAVIHTAAIADIWGSFQKFYQINVRGTRHVVEACIMENVPRLVYTSSPSVVIGDQNIENGNESLPYPTQWFAFYPQTKAEAEQYVLASNHRQMLNGERFYTCAIRPHLIWGPDDPHLIPTILQAVKKGRLRIVGSGKNRVDMTYVENAAVAHLQALKSLGVEGKANGNAYFIGDKTPVEMWQWLNQLLEKIGESPITRYCPERIAFFLGMICEWIWRIFKISGHPPMTRFVAIQFSRNHWFSHHRAKSDLNYCPLVGPEEGLALLVASLKNRK